MNKITVKRTAAFLTALLTVGTVASCGSAASSGSGEETTTTVETVVVEDKGEVDAIPDGAEKEIRWLGTYDLNPSKGADKTVEMTLFNNKGGSVVWDQVIDSEKFDKLAAAIMSKKNVPDIFKYEWLAFPCQVVKDMYQPVDEIVDFSDDLPVRHDVVVVDVELYELAVDLRANRDPLRGIARRDGTRRGGRADDVRPGDRRGAVRRGLLPRDNRHLVAASRGEGEARRKQRGAHRLISRLH